MVPQTFAALIAFLALVAPGLLFELLRERRRPSVGETAFREASRTAFTSLLFTGTAVAILAVVGALWPGSMPSPGAWLTNDDYFKTEYLLVARFALLEILLALTFALLADVLLRRRARGMIFAGSIWFQVLRVDRPDGLKPWVSLQLTDKTQIAGFLKYYSTAEKPQDREIALKNNVEGKGLKIRTPDGVDTRLDGWHSVVVRGDQIAYLKVQYLPSAPRHRRNARPA